MSKLNWGKRRPFQGARKWEAPAHGGEGPYHLRAKFAGICKRCEGPVEVGDYILWQRDTGATHRKCCKRTGLSAEERQKLTGKD